MYEGEDDSNGTWKVFTAANPVDVDFTIESDAVYVQMMFEGMDAPLHFKVSKLTPDELELIFMDRGGVLMFKAVQ
jgi:hypothetical protein